MELVGGYYGRGAMILHCMIQAQWEDRAESSFLRVKFSSMWYDT